MINNQTYIAICKKDFEISDLKVEKGQTYQLETEVKRNIFTRYGAYINGRKYFINAENLNDIFLTEQQTNRILKLNELNKQHI